MTNIQEKYFALLRYSIGTRKTIPVMTFADLRAIYKIAEKQAMLGIMLDGVKKAPVTRLADGECVPTLGEGIFVWQKEAGAYEDFVMDWVGKGVTIARRNDKLDKNVGIVCEQLQKDGFDVCLLKGQGNALMYPNPQARTSGDIDLWCLPKRAAKREEISDDDVNAVISYVKSRCKNSRAIYHHIDGLERDGIEVEMHYRPHFMLNLMYNRRLQEYFAKHAEEQFHHCVKIGGVDVPVPTTEFNMVFQLSHIYQHLFHEGIGLRQVLDYYYLASPPTPPLQGGGRALPEGLLYDLGLENIGGAVMWILINELGMDERYAICEPDSRRGSFVLNEILQGGNFGHYDKRSLSGVYASPLKANLQRLKRDWRLLSYFPSESLSEPIFRVYHWWWRRKHK